MFPKDREIPLEAQKCEALIRNLPQGYPALPEIKSAHSMKMSGYYGEKSLDYHLGALNQEKYDIYPGLRLSNKGRNFQIDTVAASNCSILAIEVKNLQGELEFDSAKGQLIQKIGDKIKVYDDPFAQVQNQRLQLMKWLESHRFPPIPVDCLVVLANNNALIKKFSGSSNHYWKLCRCVNVLEKIHIFENMYPSECITTQQRKKLMKLFLKYDTPLDLDILDRFKIQSADILTGVPCPICLTRAMKYTYGTWHCSNCDMRSKTAHFQLLNDYFLINGPSITNQQFREISHLDSRHQGTRILNSMKLPYEGFNKGRIYLPLKK